MRDLRLLLLLRLRAARNAFRFATPAQRGVGALLGLGGLLLFGVLLVAFAALLAAARTAGEPILHLLIARTTLYLFLFLLASAVPFVSSTLFAPGDLPLLLAAPTRPAALVAARLLDAVLVSAAQFVVIGVPLLLAAAWVVAPPLWGWVVFVLLLLLFLALPALLIAALLFVLVRVTGLRRVRAAVALASAVLAVGMCLLLVGEFAHQAGTVARQGMDAGALAALATDTSVPALPAWLPSTWVSDALHDLGAGRAGDALIRLAELLAATALFGGVGIWAGRGVLAGETLLEGENNGTGRTRPGALDRVLGLLPLAPPTRALIIKDGRYLARDLVLLSQIGIPVILYLVPFVIGGQMAAQGTAPGELFLLSAGVVATIAYMETSILSLSAIGLEGRAFWVVRAAPVSPGAFLRAKFAAAFLASAALCVPLFWISCAAYRASFAWTAWGTGGLLVACAALCGLGVGIAGVFPRFVYENPAHRASLSALIWGFVGATLYVLVAAGLLGGGAFAALRWPESAQWLLGSAVAFFLLTSALTAAIPLLLARARLTNYAWEH